MSTKRLDLYLVETNQAFSRTHAQELIESGQVFLIIGDKRKELKKASTPVASGTKIEVIKGPANRFVSRGGLKLEGALAQAKLLVEHLEVLDVGLSTGGFADCLLKQGARQVVGVDVGHDQVHATLRRESRLTVLEGINARDLDQNSEFLNKSPLQKFDLIVMDVSFISIELIIPGLQNLLKPQGHLLSLVKPQFEVGIDGLAKGGIVKDVSLFEEVENKIRSTCKKSGLRVLQYFPSSILGKDGNNEFFVYACKDLFSSATDFSCGLPKSSDS
jgi:23S rRNA (cytidine1920-2'-O)/16S rRNA (cytidine1409-2'-O)-methyltransferase